MANATRATVVKRMRIGLTLRCNSIAGPGRGRGAIPNTGLRDAAFTRSEQQAHVDDVPELAALASDLLAAAPLLDEAVLTVERDRRGVLGPDAQAQLVQPLLTRPLDRRHHERRAYTAPTPLPGNRHADLAEPVPAHLDVHRPKELGAHERYERPVERPARSPRLDVDRRLRGNPVTLLSDRGEHVCHRNAVFVARRTDLDRSFGHVQNPCSLYSLA